MSKLIKRSRLIGQPPGTLLYEGGKKEKEVVITIFDYDESSLVEKQVKTVDECIPFKDKPTVTWINVDGLHRVEILEKLSECYLVHHLVLEDILNINQRPKYEDFGGYVYLSAKMLSYDEKADDIQEEQVSIILGPNFLISFQEEKEGDVFGPIRERIRNNKGRIRKMKADYLAYSLLDAIVDNYFIILEKIGEKVEGLESELVANPLPQTLQAINKLKRNLIFLRRSVWPLREIVNSLAKSESALVSGAAAVYYRDVYDHLIHTIDTIEAFRDTVSGMLDIYLSSLSNRMNEVMKVLTIIATIFIPLTFIVGIYGMNFNTSVSPFNMPELNWRYGYLMVLWIMFFVASGMLAYFKKKKWF